MKKYSVLIAVLSTLTPSVANAYESEIINPLWIEIPNTGSLTNELYGDNAFINVNWFQKNDNLITFDVVNPDASYSQVQVDCINIQSRTTRMGGFITDTRVEFIEAIGPWGTVSEGYHRKLVDFACSYQ